MITPQDRSVLKTIVQSEMAWNVLNKIKQEMMIKWSSDSASAQDEFHYLRNNFERDGKLLGLTQFFQELERD